MLVIDWFMWRFPRDRKFLDSEKNWLCDKLATPNVTRGVRLEIRNFNLIIFS